MLASLNPKVAELGIVMIMAINSIYTYKGRIYRAGNYQSKGGRAGQPHGVLASGGGVAHHLCG